MLSNVTTSSFLGITDPTIIVALLVLIGVIVSATTTFIATRGKTRTDAKSALDARIDARVEVQLKAAWVKIDEMEETAVEERKQRKLRDGAIVRLFLSIAHQWIGPGPILDPQDIAIVEDLLPEKLLRPQAKGTS